MSERAKSKGLLLLNLGTPDSPEASDVRKYLAEFLMDPFVIDIPWPARAALVHGFVLPFRPKKSSDAYKKVWTTRGSPLLFHLEDLAAKVAPLLPQYRVLTAMRYQKPSIRAALEQLQAREVSDITVFPLYPQYSLAATESSILKVREEARSLGLSSTLRFVPAFYNSPPFQQAFAEATREALADFSADYILFSFHGLPERQVKKTDATGGHCAPEAHDCCERIVDANASCYRAQSFATAHALARRLDFAPEDFGKKYSVSFQSRLGRTPWIRPYTDFVLSELARRGVRKLAVVCPSFVADCLETLEEIAIRGREQFRSEGGGELRLVPSLNSRESWAKAIAEIVKEGEE